MFDHIIQLSRRILRHRTGPLLEERLAFLTHLANQGYSRRQLRRKASDLLAIAQMLGLASRPRKAMTFDEIKRKTANQRRLYSLAVRWLQFMGRLQLRPAPLTPWEKKIKAFADYMEHEAELAPADHLHPLLVGQAVFRSTACQRGFSARDHSSSDRHGVSEVARPRRLFAEDDSDLRRRTAGFLSFCGSTGLVP